MRLERSGFALGSPVRRSKTPHFCPKSSGPSILPPNPLKNLFLDPVVGTSTRKRRLHKHKQLRRITCGVRLNNAFMWTSDGAVRDSVALHHAKSPICNDEISPRKKVAPYLLGTEPQKLKYNDISILRLKILSSFI